MPLLMLYFLFGSLEEENIKWEKLMIYESIRRVYPRATVHISSREIGSDAKGSKI
jgi:hypothetical protein